MILLITGGAIGLFIGYHLGVWHGFKRLGNAERKDRLSRVGWPWRRQ